MDASFLLLLLIALQIKHFLADFPLQTAKMLNEKGYYGNVHGLLHALIHGALSLPIMLAFLGFSTFVCVLVLVEFVVHYHLDWAKEKLVRNTGWTYQYSKFWVAIGFDQLLHQITYIAMIAAIIHLW